MPPPRQLSPAQIETLLSFMDSHRDLASCVIMNNPDTKQQVNALWETLTSLLNADKDGIKKSSQAWRRYWNEKKYSVRRKAVEITRNLTSGEPNRIALTAEESKILDILGRLAGKGGSRVAGLDNTREPFQDEDSSGLDAMDQSFNEESKSTFNYSGYSVDEEQGLDAATTGSRWLSQAQAETLISFMEAHRELASGVLVRNPGSDGKQKVKELFKRLASLMNSKDGVKKSPQAWRRYWNEKKYSVRRKAMEITRCITAGEPVKLVLNAEETKILDIMGRLAGKAGSKGPEFDYTIRVPARDEDSSGLDPLDQSSNEEKFKPDSPEIHKEIPIIETKIFNFNGNTDEEPVQSSDGPPQWAIDIEERRTSASERIASCLEKLTTAVVGMHHSLQSLTEEVAAIRGALARPP